MCYYTMETIEKLIEKHTGYTPEVAEEYGEPGYTRNFPNQPIFFSNWNKVPKHVLRWLDNRINMEWEDEWITTYSSNKVYAYRTQPDCYHWKPSYIFNDWTNGEIVGRLDMEDEDLQRSYIEEYLLDDPKVCDMFDLDYAKFGFEQINGDFENGWYGCVDDPKEVLKYWQEKLPDHEFIFGSYSSGQFAVNFNLYGRVRQ